MYNRSLTTFVILALFAMLASMSGCTASDRQTTMMDQAEPQPADDESTAQAAPEAAEEPDAPPAVEKPAAKPAKNDKKIASEDDLKKKRKELDKKHRQLAKQERDLTVAQIKLEKTHISHKHEQIRNEVTLEKAEQELMQARLRMEHFEQNTVPSRIGWAQLALTRAEDNAQEAQEELEQLELMYNEDEFADQTKEIVLERGRRRLQRSQRDLELRHADFATLTEKTLPIDRRDHEMRVTDKHEALKLLRQKHETATLDQKIALIGAEGEIIKHEHALQDTREEIEELEKEIDKMVEEITAAKESQE